MGLNESQQSMEQHASRDVHAISAPFSAILACVGVVVGIGGVRTTTYGTNGNHKSEQTRVEQIAGGTIKK